MTSVMFVATLPRRGWAQCCYELSQVATHCVDVKYLSREELTGRGVTMGIGVVS